MAEKKISDLSIGDWVEIDGEPAKALCLRIAGGHIFKGVSGQMYRCCGGMDFYPISITPEMLEKNGFVKWQGGLVLIGDEISCRYEDGNLTIKQGYRDNEEALVERLLVNIECKYVHQLQHALRLAGVGKEIEV